MKTTLTLTSRGVVTLPAKLRRALGLRADDQLIAETTPDGLLLRPAVTLPVEIYSEKRIREFDEGEAELASVLRQRAAGRNPLADARGCAFFSMQMFSFPQRSPMARSRATGSARRRPVTILRGRAT